MVLVLQKRLQLRLVLLAMALVKPVMQVYFSWVHPPLPACLEMLLVLVSSLVPWLGQNFVLLQLIVLAQTKPVLVLMLELAKLVM